MDSRIQSLSGSATNRVPPSENRYGSYHNVIESTGDTDDEMPGLESLGFSSDDDDAEY